MNPERWSRVQELFHRALEIAPEQRRAFLDKSCGDDPASRAWVESLILADGQQEGLLDEAPLRAEDKRDPLLPVEEAPADVGPYRLLRRIGEGGASIVYLAERADGSYRKQVALKLIKRGMDSEAILRRFLMEREILARLDHQNIAKLLDGGATESGHPYFVMELVDGLDIRSYCERRSAGVPERIALFRSVCEAVHYAHRNLVVHRDLKPTNILVSSEGVVKLLDFGIAKLLDPGLTSEAVAWTTASVRLMTRQYASPEQVRADPITTSTDVYSLGVVLYELVSGYRPYEVNGRGLRELEDAICHRDPVAPSLAMLSGEPSDSEPAGLRKNYRTKRRRLSRDLDKIVLKALEKEPERRYASVDELAQDLERYRQHQPVLARKHTFPYRMQKLVRRHTAGVIAGALVAASLVTGLSLALWQAHRANAERARAEAEQQRAEQVSKFLVELFSVSDPLQSQGREVTAREILDRGVEKIGRELEDQPLQRATLLHTMGDVHLELGLYQRSIELLEEALALRRQYLGEEHPDLILTMVSLVAPIERLGDLDRAEALCREALVLARRSLPADDHRLGLALNNLAVVLFDRGEFDESTALLREALPILRKARGEENLDLALGLHNLAMLVYREDLKGSIELLEEALTIFRKVDGPRGPFTAMTIGALGSNYWLGGNYRKAEPMLREALAMRLSLLGEEHADIAKSRIDLALVVSSLGDYTESEALFRDAVAQSRRALGESHPQVASGLNGLGITLLHRGRYREAESELRQSVSMFAQTFGDDHPLVLRALVYVAEAANLQRKYREAQEVLEKVLATIDQRFPDEQVTKARALAGLAWSRRCLGDGQAARSLYQEALVLARKHLGAEHDGLGVILTGYAELLHRQGDSAAAESHAREALAIFRKQLPPGHPYSAGALIVLGSILVERGEASAARPMLEEALDVRRQTLPAGDWQLDAAQKALDAGLSVSKE